MGSYTQQFNVVKNELRRSDKETGVTFEFVQRQVPTCSQVEHSTRPTKRLQSDMCDTQQAEETSSSSRLPN